MKKAIIRSTPFGPVAILWSLQGREPRICRIFLSRPGFSAINEASGLFPDAKSSSCSDIGMIADRIKAFLSGENIEFDLGCIRLDLCPPFQRAVLRAEFMIPRGQISTYRLIAAHLGSARGARACGNALANNPFPIIIPCHRAIRSDLTLGGYQGGLAMKRALLENEGIGFDARGRVAAKRLHYSRGLQSK